MKTKLQRMTRTKNTTDNALKKKKKVNMRNILKIKRK